MFGGIAKLVKNIGRSADAKASAAADKIDKKNSVEFGKQEVSQMKEDLGKTNENIGSLKGEIIILKEKIKETRARIKKHEEDATELDASGKEALALKHCEQVDILMGQVEPLQLTLKQQEDLLEQQQQNKEKLKKAVQEVESDLMVMKSMRDVTNANAKLSTISTGSNQSALNKFKERKEAMKKDMLKSQAIREESEADSGDSLEAETNAALGTGGASSTLERLRAKKK